MSEHTHTHPHLSCPRRKEAIKILENIPRYCGQVQFCNVALARESRIAIEKSYRHAINVDRILDEGLDGIHGESKALDLDGMGHHNVSTMFKPEYPSPPPTPPLASNPKSPRNNNPDRFKNSGTPLFLTKKVVSKRITKPTPELRMVRNEPTPTGGRIRVAAPGISKTWNVPEEKFSVDFWNALASKLPAGKTREDKVRRKLLFIEFDPNGNGYLSLAEVDKGVRDVLACDELFDAKPAIMRAFQAAKGALKTKAKLGADYVERAEFRLLLVYLRRFFELYVMFDDVDTGDDRRVDRAEFEAALQKLGSWGVVVEDADAEFKAIDVNGGGSILFIEFCKWALSKNLDLVSDDDDDEVIDADVLSKKQKKKRPDSGEQQPVSPPKEKFSVDFWQGLASKLPAEKTDEHRQARKQMFSNFDPNGNGYLSLAEVDKGVRDVLACDELFDAKPAIMRAFQAAKGALKTKAKLGADYVERAEFRLLLVYLRRFFELYVMFDDVDTGDDRRVDRAEFEAALQKLGSWGVVVEDADAEFKAIDVNGGGSILFIEFCKWALSKNLDLVSDDDDD